MISLVLLTIFFVIPGCIIDFADIEIITPAEQEKIKNEKAAAAAAEREKKSKDPFFNFDWSSWNYSTAAVKRSEKGYLWINVPDPSEPKDSIFCTLTYSTPVFDWDISIDYHFIRDSLYSAVVKFKEDHLRAMGYLRDYNSFKSFFYRKYGKPVDEGETWSNRIHEDMPMTALSMGHMVKYVVWENDGTKITMILEGRKTGTYGQIIGRTIDHSIIYVNEDF